MIDPADSRVAVYIDFDNIVISRYDQLHGRGTFHQQRVKSVQRGSTDAVATRVEQATVDVGAILDYAASFGTPVISKAYADWSVAVNAGYRQQLLARAVDLVQLFPTTRGIKNGADIRLAVDVMEDLFRLPDITHVVIVAGDSDYIALAQKAKRLGRFVVGIGVAGSTSKSLAAACDEFADYDALPGVERPEIPTKAELAEQAKAAQAAATPAESASETGAASEQPKSNGRRRRPKAEESTAESPATEAPATETKAPPASKPAEREIVDIDEDDDEDGADPIGDAEEAAAALLERAMRVSHAKDDDEWLHANVVKAQMKRMDPSFNEKTLGYRSFTDFVTAHTELAQMREEGQARLIRLTAKD
ncbi:NYN domain-containing protein [Agrococcus jejuensis]|uniref:OST-HTH/LOTUS domain-containing protein n=1 Tax=Agrococcus jejuensis TaxID=399736 RepID=A0A1G8D8T8_9MICO|nr:NYN domain-containing protein [Agrococcus jejuensis]SDH54166.1 OST-HTH/LOTUS domain-containing protein [Agrococcus jejuensis]